MRRTGRSLLSVLGVACLAVTGCAQSQGAGASRPIEDPVAFDSPGPRAPDEQVVSPAPDVDPSSPATTPSPSPSPVPAPAPPPAPADEHPIVLTWDGIDLRLPSPRVELIGLHQSNHDGARDMLAIEGAAVPIVVMESRERDTGLQTAADIVLPPDAEVVAPVTGTVVRAGTYTLYCDNTDDFLVIEPDGRPGIEVKLLHIDGVRVAAGDRVEAGVTVVAPRPTPLPFESQVDELSGPDDDPHVHLEVVDTSVPDIPNENSGSDDC